MTTLFDPLTAGDLHLANRITMAALTRCRAGEDGVPTDLHAEYYAQRASAGLIVTEGTFPSFASRGFMGQAGIADDAQAAGWKQVTEAVHAKGGVIAMQIMHAGQVTHPELTRGATPEAPSATSTGEFVRTPHGKMDAPTANALTADDLVRVRQEFVDAARRAVDAGLDAVELHSANGYLLHEFLTPTTNLREDEYGGSPQARARFVIEVVRAVAEEIGAGRTAIRISPEHNIQGALEPEHEDAVATYQALVDGISGLGLCYLSVLYKDIDSPLMADLRQRFDGAFLLNSGFSSITDHAEAERIVQGGLADAAVIGRALIANPDLVQRWQHGQEENIPDQATFYAPGPEGYTDYPFAVQVS